MDLLNILELLDAIQSLERKLNLALMYTGLRLPQYRAMDFLEKSGKITVSDLSRQLNVTRATTSVLVAELSRAGIVQSIANKADKRSFYIKLSESGQRRLLLAREEISLVVKNISSELTVETVSTLIEFSKAIKQEK